MKKITIYFLRHGEVDNPRKILYGRLPRFGLSEKGRERINEVGRFLKDKNISVIYSSPLLRARQTASIISKYLGVKPKISSYINEVKLFCPGVPLDVYKSQIQNKLYDKENLTRGQESIGSIAFRMMKFLNLVNLKHKGSNIMVVSHGDPIMILKAQLDGVTFSWDYKQRNYLSTGHFIKVICQDKACKTV